jgi:hypothetical protein
LNRIRDVPAEFYLGQWDGRDRVSVRIAGVVVIAGNQPGEQADKNTTESFPQTWNSEEICRIES